MSKFHEAGAALSFGLVSYGLMHLLPPPDQEIQQHAAAVEICAKEMGGAGRYVDELPLTCTDFAAQLDTGSLLSFGTGVGEGHGRFYLPPYDEFIAKAEYTPNQIEAKRDMYEIDADVIGFCAAISAFGLIRWRAYIKNESSEQTSTQTMPSHQLANVVRNEDSPEWLEWAHEHGL